MSTPPSGLQAITVGQCIATVLFAHTLFSAFAAEVQLIWKRGLSTASFIFALNRVAGILYFAAGMWFVAYKSTQLSPGPALMSSVACNWSFHITEACRATIYFCVAVFTALRLYALHDKNKVIFVVVLIGGSIGPLMTLWVVISDVGEMVSTGSYYQCIAFDRRGITNRLGASQKATVFIFPLISTMVTIVLETVILIMTWRKAVGVRTILKAEGTHVGLMYILLRDGTFLYLTMLLEAVIGIPQIPWVVILYPLADFFVTSCLAYFILNLRSIYLPSGTETVGNISLSLRFNLPRTVNNFGAPIEHDVAGTRGGDCAIDEDEDQVFVADDPMAAGILMDFGHQPSEQEGSSV